MPKGRSSEALGRLVDVEPGFFLTKGTYPPSLGGLFDLLGLS
jgi:hypothetical protein